MKHIKAKLEKIIEEAEDIKSYIFRPVEDFEYAPGQYALFEIRDDRRLTKPFSLADPPDSGLIQLTTKLSGSEYKKKLESLRPGDEVFVRGPLGDFCLKGDECKLCFLAGGIGITPMKSIIENEIKKADPTDIVLFYSNRTRKSIAFERELSEISKHKKYFKAIITITDEDISDNEKFESGIITSEMISKHCPDCKDRKFHVSGPPGFNKAMHTILKDDLQIEEKNIITEDFTGYG